MALDVGSQRTRRCRDDGAPDRDGEAGVIDFGEKPMTPPLRNRRLGDQVRLEVGFVEGADSAENSLSGEEIGRNPLNILRG